MRETKLRDLRDSARAFLLITTGTGKEDAVSEHLFRFEEVRELHLVPGDWDMIAVLEVPKSLVKPPSEYVTEFVKNKVRRIAGVTHTVTLIPAESQVKA